MSAQIKAIVFDAYGTLLDINSLDGLLANHFGDKAIGLSLTWRKKQLEYTWLRTLMVQYRSFSQVTMDALEYSCKLHHLTLSPDIREQLQKEYLELAAYPEVPEVIKELSSHVLLGVLSNANLEMLHGAIKRNQLDNLFAHILSTEDVRLFKPRPEVYQMACATFGLRPHEILFVSSNTWDVAGAKSYGLTVAWINRSSGIMEELGFAPDFVLDNLEQLVGIMGDK